MSLLRFFKERKQLREQTLRDLVDAHYWHCLRARQKRVDLLNKTIRDRRAAVIKAERVAQQEGRLDR
ncbi:hypothetical protein [Leucobacter sp. OH1287]|uniref:hypothetical protein n=1 Tax=Leucobacter sp. OH1287 TaxID=2491049 RepID=UPI000F5D6919|nr:hypothetical protein [Leucobacter sp. OH1287]RRD61354.1 hypothetical protein EII30_02855 [Leucobacter sp. OH1287]